MDSDEQPLAPASSPATGLPSPTTVTPSTSGATSETEDGSIKTFEADRIFVLMQKDYRFVDRFYVENKIDLSVIFRVCMSWAPVTILGRFHNCFAPCAELLGQ